MFLHNETQLEDEKCKFQKLQNKDNPNRAVRSTQGGGVCHPLFEILRLSASCFIF